MKCRQSEILLQLAADGELTEAEQIALNAHLSQCVACRRKEAWLELVAEAFQPVQADATTGEPSLADQVVAALGQTSHQPDSKPSTVPAKKKKRKFGLLSRVAKAAFKRMVRPALAEKKASPDPSWVVASLSALQSPVTSLEGFKAMRDASRGSMTGVRSATQGVSTAMAGPVNGVRWALDKLPRRSRS
ncbi:MAG: zf-HC2 domain-containing protein [Myxococcota bacterium]|nr:zf-HC2 domain-containing protein [Myxococcota bacterium]